ncbi:MAG TPA: zinc ribbon domain-containing protein [Blastocatellia bacterium]|nr:zinc ribbon domain-containing protein [Blastocatellia bacterium]
MFCPYCAAEDRDHSQFCRSCGGELHLVRTAVQRPDSITTSAASAREEIGRAIADRIREIKKDGDLRHVVEDVLPKVEKFLESPEERRMRQFREGVISAAVGLAVILSFFLLGTFTNTAKEHMLTLIAAGGGLVAFLVGLGLIINARWFTVPVRALDTSQSAAKGIISAALSTGSLESDPPSPRSSSLPSVTEGTTRQLK